VGARVCVTGGLGFLGSRLRVVLAADGYEVVSVDRLSAAYAPGTGREAAEDLAIKGVEVRAVSFPQVDGRALTRRVRPTPQLIAFPRVRIRMRVSGAPTRARLVALLGGAVAVLALFMAAPASAQVKNGAIAFSAKRAGDRALFARSADGSRLRFIQTGGRADHAAFSPQGRRLAFTKYGPLGAQVWVSYVEGTGLRQLTTGPSDTMPAWAPTGADVVFVRGAKGRRDLYRIRADGIGLQRLTTSARNDEAPSWSIRNQIAFVRRGSKGNDIYAIGAAGGAARRITRSPMNDNFPAWSPDGRTLVFARGRPGRRNLYLIRPDGSGARRLTRAPGDESEPAFSPDGSRVVFTYRRRRSQRLYLMKTRGRAVTKLPARSLRVRRLTSPRSAARQPSWQPTGLDPVVAAAGDIACDPANPYFNAGAGVGRLCRQKMTSDLLLRADLSSILIPGDLQYEIGKLAAYQQSFHPTWGRMKALIRPALGNHDYGDPGAAGYFDYFNGPGRQRGPAGDRGAGYYSFEVGRWHVVALNSQCREVGGCGGDSPQVRWLRADLAAHPTTCTLAYFHGPRFTSGRFGDQSEDVRPFWEALYAAGADVVLSGHEHFYERFAPQTPYGVFDPGRGIRQFIVGMGGRGPHSVVTEAPNSQVVDNSILGVLQLTLRERSYRWQLVQAPSGGVVDSGNGNCH
jgi:acid phosphatase type 7